VEKAARRISEEDVDLSRFDNCGYLAAAKDSVRHHLSLSISSHSIVGRGVFAGSHRYGGLYTACELADCFTCAADGAGDLALLCYALDSVLLVQIACGAHHLDHLIYAINFSFRCHDLYYTTETPA
jgi:hypothetical protein